MNKEFRQLNAIHENDLNTLLGELKLSDDFEQGKIKCKFCKDIITQSNIYSILPESGMVNFVCDKAECVSRFHSHLEKKALEVNSKIKLSKDHA